MDAYECKTHTRKNKRRTGTMSARVRRDKEVSLSIQVKIQYGPAPVYGSLSEDVSGGV